MSQKQIVIMYFRKCLHHSGLVVNGIILKRSIFSKIQSWRTHSSLTSDM